jgi:hypothetical protein
MWRDISLKTFDQHPCMKLRQRWRKAQLNPPNPSINRSIQSIDRSSNHGAPPPLSRRTWPPPAAHQGGAGASPQVRRPQRTGSQQPLARANRCRDMMDRSTRADANPPDLARLPQTKEAERSQNQPQWAMHRTSAPARPSTALISLRLIIVLRPGQAPGIPPSARRRGACGQHRLLASRPLVHGSTAGRPAHADAGI